MRTVSFLVLSTREVKKAFRRSRQPMLARVDAPRRLKRLADLLPLLGTISQRELLL
jgi:hypothetical protein